MPKLKPPKMSVQNGFVETPAAQGLSVFASKEPDGGRGHAQNQNRGQFGPWFPGQIPDQSLLPISGLSGCQSHFGLTRWWRGSSVC
jgi:hypothetical protein